MKIKGGGQSSAGSESQGQSQGQVLEEIERLAWGFEYGREFELKRGIRFFLGRAGHIMGSAWVRFSSWRLWLMPSLAAYSR